MNDVTILSLSTVLNLLTWGTFRMWAVSTHMINYLEVYLTTKIVVVIIITNHSY